LNSQFNHIFCTYYQDIGGFESDIRWVEFILRGCGMVREEPQAATGWPVGKRLGAAGKCAINRAFILLYNSALSFNNFACIELTYLEMGKFDRLQPRDQPCGGLRLLLFFDNPRLIPHHLITIKGPSHACPA
jgi:hypothetical protein